MKTALHIQQSFNQNASRVLKETKSIVDKGIVDKVIIVGLKDPELPNRESIDEFREVIRIGLRFQFFIPPRGLGSFFGLLNYVEKTIKILILIHKYSPIFINFHRVDQLSMFLPISIFYRNANLVYDPHELETEKNGLRGFKKQLFKVYERLFIRKFKHVFVVSPSIEDWYRKTYKISNVTTVMNCPIVSRTEKGNIFREIFKIEKQSKIFIYQGGLTFGRGIEIILEAFSQLDKRNVVVFMGYGSFQQRIEEHAAQNDNIFFHPAVRPDDLPKFTGSADYGLSLIENVCLSYYYCLPNKLFEYLHAGIPTIVSNMLEMRNYIENNEVGVVCEEMSSKALVAAIEKIQTMDFKIFVDEAEVAKNQYNWMSQEAKMIEVYRKILNEK